ncbi:uncharacterized protein LOC124153725 [Ischnura elegans]|uniref:uncharacterized protein LOC124153725 n=1 Tax=Ischnura elegans TaxID=197161 RepID=UPI001ED87CAD|nr:uncharacterized protein LOC124153725 [Ischnura elegans]
MPLTFINSQKGKKLLVLENYTYSLQEKIGEKVIWRCTRYRDIKCCVRVHTTSEDQDGNVLQISDKKHSHAAEASNITARQVKNSLKKQAVLCEDHPANIVDRVTTNVTEGCIVTLPKTKSLNRIVQRERNRHKIIPVNLNLVAELDIPDEYKKTIRDSRANRRVTLEQRELMLAFMMEHPQIAAGRVPGAEMKQELWEQLTRLLNGCRNGSTKSTDKWCKSWQDWKTDTKVKAIKVRRQNQSVGPGGMNINMTVLEDKLLRFIKTISSIGVNGVLEQLNTSNSQSCDPDITVKEEPLEDPPPMAPPSPFELSLENQSPSEPVDTIQESAIDDYEDHSDRLPTLRDPQTEALQNIAVSMDRMASAMESMASAIQNAVMLAGKFLDNKS